jgi:adenylylsulfate kinase
METARRSLIKALSWRFFATSITTTVAYFVTGEIEFAMEVGAIDTVAKLFVYYAHERVWMRIPYGKVEAPDYQI